MTKPITPEEVKLGGHIPDEVIVAFNELIAESRGGVVLQEAAITRIMSKMPDVTRHQMFEKGWLDVEDVYRSAGWKVTYDKPGYNESYAASWTFCAARSSCEERGSK